MVRRADDTLGRFSVEVELANNEDVVRADARDIRQDQVRRLKIRGVVDSGAARLVLPESATKQLRLKSHGSVKVRYADGRDSQRETASNVQLTFAGRDGIFTAVIEPNRASALIGAIVMEDLDLIVDCTNQQFVPRDPTQIISEIE